MTKHLLTALALITVLSATAQTEGVVTYEETIKITIEVPLEYRDMIPKERKQKKLLYFTEQESLYKNAPEETNVANEIAAGQQGGMRFQGMRSNTENYKHFEQERSIEKQTFFGRDFLISGDEQLAWKMSNEQRQIAGYLCMKATAMRDTIPVVAWFTPQIPVATGPGSIGQLPGMVLVVDVNNGMYSIVATDVALRPLTAEEKIVPPAKGKEVSLEEFNKIRDEKMKEMREMGGGPGGMRFMMRGN